MKRWPALFLASTLALVTGGAANVWASITWTYDWTPSGDNIVSDNGNSSIQMLKQTQDTRVGNSDVVAVNLNPVSTALDEKPDKFTHQNYFLKLKLTDVASGAFTTLAFSGFIDGWLSAHSTITHNTFNNPVTYSDLHLGDNIYSVTLNAYTGPGSIGGKPGGIGATVTAAPGENVHHAAEPTSLLLAGLGLSFVGLVGWRKRKPAAR